MKSWYKVITPREDLREGRPLDPATFTFQLDDVRNNCAPADYQKPDRFFARIYLAKNLATLASEVVRQLSRKRVETSGAFNLATQFGGGKTHALALLHHLGRDDRHDLMREVAMGSQTTPRHRHDASCLRMVRILIDARLSVSQ